MLNLLEHPLLALSAFSTVFPKPLGEIECFGEVTKFFSLGSNAPLSSSDEIRKLVRDLLRVDGFKPTGRSKPASEYLIRAADQNKLGPINLAVDCCNAVSLHSGLPISVIDFEKIENPLSIEVAPVKSSYVFNQSGQTIDIGSLLCLRDAAGFCACAVKDSQRTKTDPETKSTLTLIWGINKMTQHVDSTFSWYRELLENCGAKTEIVFPT